MKAILILAVGDSERSLILLHQVLVYLGHSVVLAGNLREAVSQADRHHPDLILVDADVPGEAVERLMGLELPLLRLEGPIVLDELAAALERALTVSL